jgi:hypothetical protein
LIEDGIPLINTAGAASVAGCFVALGFRISRSLRFCPLAIMVSSEADRMLR